MDTVDILRKSNSWPDYKRRLHSLNDKQKGDCFELLTKYYLQLHPTYTTQLKKVWVLNEVPPRIRKHLNLPGSDEGIDLIAETKDSSYWAIQCKYKTDETKSLTRKELSTFTDLAFNICKKIELGLVCTTADRFSRKLTLYGEKLTFCAGDKWRELDATFFRRLHRHLGGKAALLKPFTARPHQRSAINSAYRHYYKEGNTRGKLIMPCGTGKSLTGYWIAKKLGAQKILIAVPSLALIRQTLEVWARESFAHKQDVSWIAVCSDETVGQIERDDVAVLAQDLGVRVHTNPEEIARWLRAHQDGSMVVFTTYQSGRVTAEAARKARLIFDLGILDEAHKTVGKQDSLFSHLLSDGNIKIDKRIFMTATERRYRGRSDQIASMDDPDIYGEDFEVLSFKKALEADPPILSDYKIITIGVTRDEIADLVERNAYVKPDKGKWDDEVEAEMLAGVIALRKAMKKKRIRHAVSFHNSIARARAYKATQDRFTSAFPAFGNLETFHVSGNTPTAVRSRELDEFAASKRSLITNARCLTEGVDVPDIDCVLFADPKRSTVDIVQAVGRALRTAEGKKYGYVIVPVLLDDDLEGSKAFEPVLTILRALAANDDRIVEYFRRISEGRKVKGGNVDISIDIPHGFVIDADAFINSIELRFWSRLAKLSWRPFEEARGFVQSLNLNGTSEWQTYRRGELLEKGSCPLDIPSSPHMVYKGKGWKSYGDWLGTGRIASRLHIYRNFSQAREFARSQKLKGKNDWNSFCQGELKGKRKLPDDIPRKPEQTYKDKGWIGYGDWLGTGNIAKFLRTYRDFNQARDFARGLKLKTQKQWNLFCQGKLPDKGALPDDIPSNPNQSYKDKGWIGIGDWLGTGRARPVWRPFNEARDFTRSLGLKRQQQWFIYCHGALPEKGIKPKDIPIYPNESYRNEGWLNFGDWLGTGRIANFLRTYQDFNQARDFSRDLKLKTRKQWNLFCQGKLSDKGTLPDDIPAKPDRAYKDKGWVNFGDWLGTGNIHFKDKQFRSFKSARVFVRKLGLKNQKEWILYRSDKLPSKGKIPSDIPSNPNRTYKNNGWVSLCDWLGTSATAPRYRKYRSFTEARKFVHSLNLKSLSEWDKHCKGEYPSKPSLPDDIPKNFWHVYKNKGYVNAGDFLGSGVIANTKKEFRSFKIARAFVRRLNLGGQKEWKSYCKGELKNKEKLPIDIPKYPSETYKDKGWISIGDWLGTGSVASYKRKYLSFNKARTHVHKLNLKSWSDWQRYCKGELKDKGSLPSNIPACPNGFYRDKGWKNWPDWLGTKTKPRSKS